MPVNQVHRPPRVLVPILGLATLFACNYEVKLGGLSASDSGTTDSADPNCGDGVVQVGEECDNAGDDADGCLSTCEIATICAQILTAAPNAVDGVYTIDPDGAGPNTPFDVYCDMTTDDGGWILVAKVHRWHVEPNYDEPAGWFAREHDTETLVDALSYEARLTANASHGEARIGPAIPSVTLARFILIAEDDVTQRLNWYKGVADDLWSWFSVEDHGATLVCTDLAMTQNCSEGRILAGLDPTWLEGMFMNDYGFSTIQNPCSIHMRHNEEANFYPSGVSSCTGNNDGNAWHDDAIDGHWGNGLEIWLR